MNNFHNFLNQFHLISESNRLLNETMNQLPKYKQVIDDDVLLEKIPFCQSHRLNDSCPIFHIPFQEHDEIIELPCRHCFSPDAIEKWLRTEKNMCPVCRYKLKGKEIPRYSNPNPNLNTTTPIDINMNENTQFNNERMIHLPGYSSNSRRRFPTLTQLLNHILENEEEADLQIAMYASLFTSPETNSIEYDYDNDNDNDNYTEQDSEDNYEEETFEDEDEEETFEDEEY